MREIFYFFARKNCDRRQKWTRSGKFDATRKCGKLRSHCSELWFAAPGTPPEENSSENLGIFRLERERGGIERERERGRERNIIHFFHLHLIFTTLQLAFSAVITDFYPRIPRFRFAWLFRRQRLPEGHTAKRRFALEWFNLLPYRCPAMWMHCNIHKKKQCSELYNKLR